MKQTLDINGRLEDGSHFDEVSKLTLSGNTMAVRSKVYSQIAEHVAHGNLQ